MSFKRILGKKVVVAAGAGLVAAAGTVLVYFLSKNAVMEEVDEIVNEDRDKKTNNMIEVDFQEEEQEQEQEQEEEEVELSEEVKTEIDKTVDEVMNEENNIEE